MSDLKKPSLFAEKLAPMLWVIPKAFCFIYYDYFIRMFSLNILPERLFLNGIYNLGLLPEM